MKRQQKGVSYKPFLIERGIQTKQKQYNTHIPRRKYRRAVRNRTAGGWAGLDGLVGKEFILHYPQHNSFLSLGFPYDFQPITISACFLSIVLSIVLSISRCPVLKTTVYTYTLPRVELEKLKSGDQNNFFFSFFLTDQIDHGLEPRS